MQQQFWIARLLTVPLRLLVNDDERSGKIPTKTKSTPVPNGVLPALPCLILLYFSPTAASTEPHTFIFHNSREN